MVRIQQDKRKKSRSKVKIKKSRSKIKKSRSKIKKSRSKVKNRKSPKGSRLRKRSRSKRRTHKKLFQRMQPFQLEPRSPRKNASNISNRSVSLLDFQEMNRIRNLQSSNNRQTTGLDILTGKSETDPPHVLLRLDSDSWPQGFSETN
jgi:hypothetical protein